MYPYGLDFTYQFTAIVDSEEVVIPTQTPAIYVFDKRPSRTEAQAGTGAIQTITTWTETSAYVRSFTISAIDDPDPTAESIIQKEYYVAVNFKLQTGEQTQTHIRYLQLQRPDGAHKRLKVSIEELENVYSELLTYATVEQVYGYISAGFIAIKGTLKSKGFEWAQIYRPDLLKQAYLYKVLHLFAIAQKGDEMRERAAMWAREYKELTTSIEFDYDGDKDGSPEAVVKAPNFWIAVK